MTRKRIYPQSFETPDLQDLETLPGGEHRAAPTIRPPQLRHPTEGGTFPPSATFERAVLANKTKRAEMLVRLRDEMRKVRALVQSVDDLLGEVDAASARAEAIVFEIEAGDRRLTAEFPK